MLLLIPDHFQLINDYKMIKISTEQASIFKSTSPWIILYIIHRRFSFLRVSRGSRTRLYYMSTEIYLKSKLSNKNGLSKTRNNLIGHTIFLTSEKYRMTNHRPHTKFFTSEKIVSVFPAFRRSFHSECSQLSLPLNHGFKVCRHCFSRTIYRRPRKRKHKKENSTECCFAEGISEAEERVKTYRRNSPKGAECIHRRIYHYGTKERQQRRLWTQLLTFFDGQFWTVFKEEELWIQHYERRWVWTGSQSFTIKTKGSQTERKRLVT